MKLSTLACLLLHISVASSVENCSFYHIVKHLNLSDKDKFTLVRPVNDHPSVTNVTLLLTIYAILDVQEIGQKFKSSLLTITSWQNDFIQWDPKEFCGIRFMTVPTETLWKPDIIIEDMIDKDKTTHSPYLHVSANGRITHKDDRVVVSTCRILAYKFPFDTQSCNLTFRSATHSVADIHLTTPMDSNTNTEVSHITLKTDYEWKFINVRVTEDVNIFDQDIVTYTIRMERRWGLYVVNYIMPLLFFLFLDFASFLMSDTGDKLGFKITILLAVTVMQLLFNEILPASSDYIPLIAVFCVGIFSLMLLSLVECLLVLCLLNKDGSKQQDQDEPYRRLKDVISLSQSAVPSNSSLDKTQVLDDVLAALTELLQNKREETEPGYWAKKVTIINRVFIVFYFTGATVFLGTVFYCWLN